MSVLPEIIIVLLDRYGLIIVVILAVLVGVRRVLDRLLIRYAGEQEIEYEKPKRKRRPLHNAYTARLEEIDKEADYQRALAHQEYLRTLMDTAQPMIVIGGALPLDDEVTWDVYTPIYGLSEE